MLIAVGCFLDQFTFLPPGPLKYLTLAVCRRGSFGSWFLRVRFLVSCYKAGALWQEGAEEQVLQPGAEQGTASPEKGEGTRPRPTAWPTLTPWSVLHPHANSGHDTSHSLTSVTQCFSLCLFAI